MAAGSMPHDLFLIFFTRSHGAHVGLELLILLPPLGVGITGVANRARPTRLFSTAARRSLCPRHPRCAKGEPQPWWRMRTPARLPCSPLSAAPARLPWRPRGPKPGEDPASSPPPPPSPGAPLLFESITPDCVGAGAVEDSPSPPGRAADGACARVNTPPPRRPAPHRESPNEGNKVLRTCAAPDSYARLVSLATGQLRGTPF